MSVAKISAANCSKSQNKTKLYEIFCPTFSKLTGTFKFWQLLLLEFCHVTKTKPKVVSGQPVKLLAIVSGEIDMSKTYL